MVVKHTHNFVTSLLSPIYSAYASVSHKRVLVNMQHPEKLPVPVISVGNITFGGTAKTPMAEHIVNVLSKHGYRPGVVLRGWMGNIERRSECSNLVSDGKTIFMEWEDSGDEARLLAENLLPLEIPVAVGRDRAGASKLLMKKTGADIIILDDGYQFTGLERDFDVVLIDSIVPFGRADGGPGLVREPVSALERADVILLTRSEAVGGSRIEDIKNKIRKEVQPTPPVFTVRTIVKGIRDIGTDKMTLPDSLEGCRVTAFAGIGNPLGFESTLQGTGCDLRGFYIYPDHHVYSRKDMSRINQRATMEKSEIVLTTSKDAIRLGGLTDAISVPVRVVEIELSIDDESRFITVMADGLGIHL